MGVGSIWSELAEFYSCIYERQACRAPGYKIYEQKFNVELFAKRRYMTFTEIRKANKRHVHDYS